MTESRIQAVIRRRQTGGRSRRTRRTHPLPPPVSDGAWGSKLIIGLGICLLGNVLGCVVEVFVWIHPMANRVCWGLTLGALLIAVGGVWGFTACSRTSADWQRPRRWLTRLLYLACLLPASLGMFLGPYVYVEDVPGWLAPLLLGMVLVGSFATIFLNSYLAELSGLFGNKVLGIVYKTVMLLAVLGTILTAIRIIVYLGDSGEHYLIGLKQEMIRLYGEKPMNRSSAGISTMDIIFPGRFMLNAFITWVRTFIFLITPGVWLIATIRRKLCGPR